jgi:hypothetical protein
LREFPKCLPWFILSVAVFFLSSPLWLYWYIHGDQERYMQIIEGPIPIGSGPYQLGLGIGFLFIGVVLFIVSILLFKMSKFK